MTIDLEDNIGLAIVKWLYYESLSDYNVVRCVSFIFGGEIDGSKLIFNFGFNVVR